MFIFLCIIFFLICGFVAYFLECSLKHRYSKYGSQGCIQPLNFHSIVKFKLGNHVTPNFFNNIFKSKIQVKQDSQEIISCKKSMIEQQSQLHFRRCNRISTLTSTTYHWTWNARNADTSQEWPLRNSLATVIKNKYVGLGIFRQNKIWITFGVQAIF